MLRENVADLLVATCQRFEDRAAIVRGEERTTYRELADGAARVAAFLRGRGVEPGDRVGIALRNSAEYVQTMLGAAWIGALPFNVNYKYKAEELAYVLEDAHAVALIHDQAVGDNVVAHGRAPGDLRLLIAALGATRAAIDGAATWAEVLATEPIEVGPSREEGEWLLYTGGTTGLPKGVASRHGDLLNTLGKRAFDYLDEPAPGDRAEFVALLDRLTAAPERHVRNLVAPPAMHATGTYATLGTLLTGGTVIYLSQDSFDPADMARLLQSWSVTHLTIVGDAFARPLVGELRRAARAGQPYDVSALKVVHSVGAAWSSASKAALLEFCDPQIEDILASTETGRYAAMTTRRVGDQVRTELRPFEGVRVVDDAGRDVAAGSEATGYLAVPVSDAVNYVGEGDTSTFHLLDGKRYCLPGDLAVVLPDGSLELRGRSNRAINTGGEKVFAEEVEAVLLDHPDVRDAVVVGRPDERWGTAVVALVVADDVEGTPTEASLREFVSSRLANYKSPKQIRFVTEIPRVASGKADLTWANSQEW